MHFWGTICFFFVLSLQMIRTIMCRDLDSAFSELIQEYLTVVTFWLFWNHYHETKNEYAYDDMSKEWISCYYLMVICSALGIFFQYFLFLRTHRVYGFASIWTGRQSFDLLFSGYSVLSVLIGGGMVIAVSKILDRHNSWYNLGILMLLSLACGINSARSGFFAAIAIIAIMVINAFQKKRITGTTLIISTVAVFVISFSLYYLVSRRTSISQGRLFAGHGRIELARAGLEQIQENSWNFLFGIGINGAQIYGLSQHNMFLEMQVLNGVFFFVPFTIAVLYILYVTRKKTGRFLLWHILLAHQLISSFFATTFLLPVLIIAISSELEKLPTSKV